ncbi:MAG: hypothetical protein H8E20_13390 [Verrucomicrobia bacterium]|nr:hypothetical protein [Verrucomicrobiota bacterium]
MKITYKDFVKGLVFGFDMGTASIGWAVRHGDRFLDVGVLICPESTEDLKERNSLRRQRRTVGNRRYRRRWLKAELEKLGLPCPQIAIPEHPATLRCRALNGEPLAPKELHAAISHLWKRRGYTDVPWADNPDREEDKEAKKEKGVVKQAMGHLRQEMDDNDCQHPCQLLERRREKGHRLRKEYWPRELLIEEHRAICEAQKHHQPELHAKMEWLLFGDLTKVVDGFRVYDSLAEGRNPGVVGLRWPRFENRGPALDALAPLDETGRPRHVVRKNKPAYLEAQWELALMNFRVVDVRTRSKVDPLQAYPKFIEALREEWDKKGKITLARLKRLAAPFESEFVLNEDQTPLTPQLSTGRARYASPTLKQIQAAIAKGDRVDPPQPVLRREGESRIKALHRYLREIRHPLVRHRLILFQQLLEKLEKEFGIPDLVVMEAVRSLALSPKKKRELSKRNEEHRKNREQAHEALKNEKHSTSGKSIQRYRLWKEVKGICPFCHETIDQADLFNGNADIEHMVPRHRVDSSEWINLTVGHLKCNRTIKGERTPFEAFGRASNWPELKDHAEQCFRGRKLEIFLSPDAESLLESKADLQHTAYIARVSRHIALLQYNWLGNDGRDPTPEKQNPALSFQVTNGHLTSRLRRAWGLNQILHPMIDGRRWEDLSEEEQEQFKQKNRGDHRHHALDAMVIACTLPWMAHRGAQARDSHTGEDGWWHLDEATQRIKAINPVFPKEGEMRRVAVVQMEKLVVQHHTSRSNHKQAYYTTLYGKKGANTYVAREPLGKRMPKNLNNIYPTELAEYCQAAWMRYEDESPDLAAELKQAKRELRGLPAAFEAKLCFSHFQRWREQVKKGEAHFDWPEKIKTPIRNIKVIGVHDDTAVAPAAPGTHAFVKRGAFKEVRVFPSQDGKRWVPVFVPFGKHDQPIAAEEWDGTANPVKIIRKGDTINLKNGSGPSNPPGLYRVASTMQNNIKLLPINIANIKEALLASGFLANGANIIWPTFFTAMAHELPHPPSAEPPASGSD